MLMLLCKGLKQQLKQQGLIVVYDKFPDTYKPQLHHPMSKCIEDGHLPSIL